MGVVRVGRFVFRDYGVSFFGARFWRYVLFLGGFLKFFEDILGVVRCLLLYLLKFG